MMLENNKLTEGIEAINRVKLLMGYDMSKTLTENKENVLIEQSSTQLSQDITKKIINSLSKNNDDEEEVLNQVKRINTIDILKNVNNLIKKRTGMSLKDYIDDEMSDTLDPEYRQIMDHIDTLGVKPTYRRQGYDQPNIPIQKGEMTDVIQDAVGIVPYSQMRTKLTPEYKKKFQEKHPEYVWDPNYVSTRTWTSNSGQQHTEKIKTGGFVKITPENMGLRGTPFGFSTVEYPTYLKKKSEILKKYPKGDDRDKELTKLKNQYYHKDFPSGITQKDFVDRMTVKNDLTRQQKKELDSIEKLYKDKTSSLKPGITLYPEKDVLNQYRKKYLKIDDKLNAQLNVDKKYKTLNDYMDAVYEYDPYSIVEISKSALEKWWDEWGSIAELGLWLAADFLTDSLVLYLSETRQATLWADIVLYLGRSGLPVAVGLYDTIKNGHLTEDGIVDFIFAVLPWAHEFFGIAKKPTVELVESIVNKRKGLSLKNPDDVRKFMKLLTEEEKGLFRSVARLTKSQKENGIKTVMKELEKKGYKKVYEAGKAVEKTTGETIKPSLSAKIGGSLVTITKDLTVIEIAKKICSHFGLLNDEEKEKKLAVEFNKRKGTNLLVFMSNVVETIKENPNLDVNGIISKSVENYYAKNSTEAVKIFTQNQLTDLLSDKNGPVDINGNPIKN